MYRMGYKVNVIIYLSLIRFLCKVGWILEVCNLLLGMRINGCNLNDVIYNGFIVGLGGVG